MIDTVYTVTFENLVNDKKNLILNVIYYPSNSPKLSTQLVLRNDGRNPNFISRNPKDWKNSEYQSITNQANAWCDSLDFPRPNWEQIRKP